MNKNFVSKHQATFKIIAIDSGWSHLERPYIKHKCKHECNEKVVTHEKREAKSCIMKKMSKKFLKKFGGKNRIEYEKKKKKWIFL